MPEEYGFGDLIAHYDSVQSYLERRVRCPHAAADLTQDTYVRALRYYDARGPPENPRAWLRTIALNLARDYSTRRRCDIVVDDVGPYLPPDTRHPDPVDALVAAEDAALLREAIDALPSTSRNLLHGFYFEGKGCRELGEQFNVQYSNVKIRLYRARSNILKHLDGSE